MIHEKKGTVYIYTDGSCLKNPGGPGGWCAIMRFHDGTNQHEKILSGRDGNITCTNNRMELTAPLRGLQSVKNHSVKVLVVSDSKYFVNGFTDWMFKWARKGWVRTGPDYESDDYDDEVVTGKVLNQDLWEQLYALREKFARIDAKYVKGHAGNEHNERADNRAREEALGLRS